MKLIRLVWFLVLAVAGISIAISNRQDVSLALEPIPYAISVPLYAVIFGALFFGILIGWATMWWRDGRVRRRARRAESQARSLEAELKTSSESKELQTV